MMKSHFGKQIWMNSFGILQEPSTAPEEENSYRGTLTTDQARTTLWLLELYFYLIFKVVR